MSQICSKIANFLFSAYFGGHFCYHSNGKSQINTRYLHFGYCSNKLIRRKCWKTFFIFLPLRRAKIASQRTYIFNTYMGWPIFHQNIYLQWFSNDSITGHSDVLKALAAIASTTSCKKKQSIQTVSYSKSCLKRPLKNRQRKILMTNGSLMKVESIAECSLWSILQYL